MKNGIKRPKKKKHATYLQIFQMIIHVPFFEAVTWRHEAQCHLAVGAVYGSLDFISLQFAHHTNSPPMRSIRTKILRIALLRLGRWGWGRRLRIGQSFIRFSRGWRHVSRLSCGDWRGGCWGIVGTSAGTCEFRNKSFPKQFMVERNLVLSFWQFLVKDETVDYCDVKKMKEEGLVPFCGFVEDVIILYEGIWEINASHVFAVVLHSGWNRN